jgi:hypothetical protein
MGTQPKRETRQHKLDTRLTHFIKLYDGDLRVLVMLVLDLHCTQWWQARSIGRTIGAGEDCSSIMVDAKREHFSE